MSNHTTHPLRVLIVDDEALARQRLVDLLAHDPQIGEVLEANDGTAAVDMIEAAGPDLAFLDVQMPRLDGFGVIQMLGAERMPPTVFVTAYDRYAVRAFEADAADYLVKPFSDERFFQALSRAKLAASHQKVGKIGSHVLAVASKRSVPSGLWNRLVIKSGGITRFLMASDIDWIEAADVYVNLHVQGKELLYRAALHQLAQRLDPNKFVRIHRSTIVNIERIASMEPMPHGGFELVLIDGTRLNLSRRYRAEFEQKLGQRI